jgi:acetate kinase
MFSLLTDPQAGALAGLEEVEGIGHRVVHGGEHFFEATLLDQAAIEKIEHCSELAPLHNPAALAGIRACRQLLPRVPQVAVFDTAFHQTLPREAYVYGLPYSLYEKHRLRKYGFHGTSHRYVSERAAAMLGRPLEELRIVTAHLGNGASMAAVSRGRSVETSMGLTPLDGLLMGTRTGCLDPGAVCFLAQKESLTPEQLLRLLNEESGLLGLSGLSRDMREVLAAAQGGDARARLAVSVFCYRVRFFAGAYAAVMGGLDALAFTAGIGENSPPVRAACCQGLEFLGLALDPQKNESAIAAEADISREDAPGRILVIPTNEELLIARDTARLIASLPGRR